MWYIIFVLDKQDPKGTMDIKIYGLSTSGLKDSYF